MKKNPIMVFLILVGIGFFAYYIYNAVRWIGYPNSTDFGEGYVMNYARMWADGTWKWNITTPPYFTMVYGLGFPILMTPLVNLFGAELWVGRIVSFVSALIACVLVLLIVKRLSHRNSYALLASLLPATQPIFRDWSVMARVDMPAVMFDLLGFYLVVRYRKSKWLYLSIVPFIFAMMIKLTAIAGLLAVIVYLVFVNRKRALTFVGITFLGMYAMFFATWTISGGEYWKHVLLYQNTIQNLNLPVFMMNWKVWFYPFMVIFVGALFYLKRYKWASMASLFFGFAVVIDMVTTFRPGSATMYYYEAIFGGCMCFALALPYILKRLKPNTSYITLGIAVSLLVFLGAKTDIPLPDGKFNASINEVKLLIGNSKVVTENPSLVDGKALYIEPFVFTNLARLGYWDETNYLNDYKQQKIEFVVLKLPLDEKIKYLAQGYPDSDFTDGALQAIKDNYTLIYENRSNPDWRCYLCVYEANRMVQR